MARGRAVRGGDPGRGSTPPTPTTRAPVLVLAERVGALLLLVGFLGLVRPGGVAAQGAGADQEAGPETAGGESDRAAVRQVVRALFDGMRAGDTTAMRALVHPETRLARPVREAGGVRLSLDPVEAWLEGVGRASGRSLDERTWDVEVRVRGDLATAWMDYAFYLDGELSHCGVNAFQLYRSDAGWKVFQVADVAKREGCEVPEAARPKG